MKEVIGITGSPAVGKRTVGKLLARLCSFNFVDGNEVIKSLGVAVENDEFVVDLEKGKRAFNKIASHGKVIISSLFLPDLLSSELVDLVVVLRCDPRILYYRYLKRNYPLLKLKENLTSEFIDYCYVRSLKIFGDEKVVQLDATRRSPQALALKIYKMWEGEERRAKERVDWLSIITSPSDIVRFLI